MTQCAIRMQTSSKGGLQGTVLRSRSHPQRKKQTKARNAFFNEVLLSLVSEYRRNTKDALPISRTCSIHVKACGDISRIVPKHKVIYQS